MKTLIVPPRSRSSRGFVIVIACVLTALTAAAAEPPNAESYYLRHGDRVVFYGDSITEQASYTLPIETYLRTRCPEIDVQFINSGWGGDRAWGGEGGMLAERLRRDVVAHRPTVVTVMLGMNDGYYTNHADAAVAAYKQSLSSLIETLQRDLPGVRITLMGTSPYDNVTPGEQPDWERGIQGGYDSVIARYSAAAKEVAEQHGLLFVDMHAPLVRMLEALQADDPQLARQLIPDRIHPGRVAGLVMAGRLLDAWHVPAANEEIEIDASGMKASGKVGIERQRGLPFPRDHHDPLVKRVFEQSRDVQRFAGDTLRVTNLPFLKAVVEIDGQKCGQFSAQQLKEGIDLSALNSPLSRQASAVAKLVELRHQAQTTRWRTLEWPFSVRPSKSVSESVDKLLEAEEALTDAARAISKPQNHTIEIVGAKE